MISLSEENYLKAIYHLQGNSTQGVSTNALAEEMNTKASSVTDMLKKLSEKDLVNYKKYQGVRLSRTGRESAVGVIRKHRLWEYFLVEKLEFTWDEVHEVAEQLEHIQSDKLIKELDNFLGYPSHDPHGDPIPDAKGNFPESNKLLLKTLEKGDTGVFFGVRDSSSEFLQYLDRNQISLGQKIKVLEKENYDDSLRVEMGGKELQLSNRISANLYVKKT